MKLRIKGNSIRFRVTRSELDTLVDDGRIEETVWLGTDAQSRLTYALQHVASANSVTLRFNLPEIAVLIPTHEIRKWRGSGQVGVYASIPLGARSPLQLAVEKDFACLDRSDADNLDTFPNPNADTLC